MLKVTNEDHFFHVKQLLPTTVSKHLWFCLKEPFFCETTTTVENEDWLNIIWVLLKHSNSGKWRLIEKRSLSKMVTTFPLIQGLGRPQIIIVNHVSVYNRSVKNDRFVLLQASSSFTIKLWEEKTHRFLSSWWFFATHLKNLLQSGNHFPNFSWWTFQKSLTPLPFF